MNSSYETIICDEQDNQMSIKIMTKEDIKKLSLNDLIDKYDATEYYIDNEGWEYDVTDKDKELYLIIEELQVRGLL